MWVILTKLQSITYILKQVKECTFLKSMGISVRIIFYYDVFQQKKSVKTTITGLLELKMGKVLNLNDINIFWN